MQRSRGPSHVSLSALLRSAAGAGGTLGCVGGHPPPVAPSSPPLGEGRGKGVREERGWEPQWQGGRYGGYRCQCDVPLPSHPWICSTTPASFQCTPVGPSTSPWGSRGAHYVPMGWQGSQALAYGVVEEHNTPHGVLEEPSVSPWGGRRAQQVSMGF